MYVIDSRIFAVAVLGSTGPHWVWLFRNFGGGGGGGGNHAVEFGEFYILLIVHHTVILGK
jgi:hypothetical protein